jgi:serine palmitoyltransferase
LEKLTAKFFNTEDAIIFGTNFTNAHNLPSLFSSGCLVVSDEQNHASIILGLRISGVNVKIYKHNDVESLDKIIEKALIDGQPVTGAPWRKILIVLEGVFSMDASIARLPEIIAIKKKYGAYIYIDEAHSAGVIGKRGRGATDYYGIDPTDIDILMGSFTKTFGSLGGFIAGSKRLITFLRTSSQAHCYATSMTPAAAQHALTSMKIIMGLDGTNEGKNRINQLARNTRYFRQRLAQIGVIVYGHEASPVVPVLVFFLSKMEVAVREFIKKKIAVIGVGFPATPLMKARIRFCLSAAHNKEQLDVVLDAFEEISEMIGLKYSKKSCMKSSIEY